MGSASSKPARKLGATAASKPAAPGVGARAAPHAPNAQAAAPHGAEAHETSRFTKDQSILQDARDPQFLQNLQALGAVEVRGLQDRPGKSDAMLGILQARAQHEGEDAAAPAAGLSVPELVRLLEEYRGAPSNATLDQLAIDYDIDRAVLQRLVRFVSVPDEQPLPPAA